MSSYTVRIIYNKGESNEYVFPLVQSVPDPFEGIKANVISGNRASGVIIIPAGKKSQEIIIKGKLFSETGYVDLMSKINTMKTKVGTGVATITKEYWDSSLSGGGGWNITWSYTIRRIEPINFGDSFQTDIIDYTVNLLILTY